MKEIQMDGRGGKISLKKSSKSEHFLIEKIELFSLKE